MAEPFVCTTGSYKNEITARDCAFALSIRDEKIYKTDTTLINRGFSRYSASRA